MPKINQKEYEILKNLDEKWKWIARNNLYGGHLEAHTTEPQRMYDSHWSNGDMTCKIMGEDRLFKFIQWENEPYNIQDLIWEYEFKELTEFILELEKETFEKLAESEEKEVNFKEKLKQEIRDAGILKHYIDDDTAVEIELPTLDYIIDKMPETLSSDWIDEHSKAVTYDGMPDETEVVYVDDLQNLLVPKQGTLSPVEGILKEIIRLEELEKDIEKLTGLTLEEIKEEARSGGIVPKQEEITEEQAWKVLADKFDWSWSGLRANVINLVKALEGGLTMGEINDVASGYKLVIEKPTVPPYIHDHIKAAMNHSQESTAIGKIYEYMLPRIDEVENNPKVHSFLDVSENQDLVALAMILEDWEVEEEPKYRVRLGDLYVSNYNLGQKDARIAADIKSSFVFKEEEKELADKVAFLVNGVVEEVEE